MSRRSEGPNERPADEAIARGPTQPPTHAPLDGLRVVAVEQFGAGPYGTLLLADLGAEVIKIEDPGTGGDVSRYIPPVQDGTDSLYFEAVNRNKRSLTLDLKNDAGREVFERLVATADAVFSNLRGDQPERLGLTWDALQGANERIVCVSLTGYGRKGEDARLPGYDALVQAGTGWAALTGGPDDPPIKSGLSLADYATGLAAMVGLLAGVLDARRTGVGRDVDTNLFDVSLSMLTHHATWYLSAGIETERQPMSGHASVVPFQFFATADGHIAIACAKERFFRSLLEVVGVPELADDERFADMGARGRHRRELLPILADRIAADSTATWMARLKGRVPAAPVTSMEGALDLDRLQDRSMLVEYDHERFGRVRSVAPPVVFAGYEPQHRPGPALGGDGGSILAELGYDAAEQARLRDRGAFGAADADPA